jgi:hypothetical protein
MATQDSGNGPTEYVIDIMMSGPTVRKMKEAGFALYGFKAVKTANGGAAPVVWFQTLAQVLMQTTTVSWTEQYQAYVSTSQIIPNGSITASSAIDIGLGETAGVDQYGNLTIDEQGTASAISLNNEASAPWTSGISQLTGNGTPSPMVALPLYGNIARSDRADRESAADVRLADREYRDRHLQNLFVGCRGRSHRRTRESSDAYRYVRPQRWLELGRTVMGNAGASAGRPHSDPDFELVSGSADMIQIYDAVERQLVATGAAIIALQGAGNCGVTHCVLQVGRRLQVRYSYNLINTGTGQSVSAECTAPPGLGMGIASFHLN